MQQPAVAACWGVEIDPVKCSKGRAYIDLVVRDLTAAGLHSGAWRPSMVCVPVEQVRAGQLGGEAAFAGALPVAPPCEMADVRF
jgi:hypothetical protein